MKRKLLLIVGLLMLVAGGYAAAAMVSVSAERNVTANVSSDLNGAAIKFTPLGDFKDQGVLKNKDGVVYFDLDAVVKDTDSLNKNATFTIGNNNKPVFSITNNLAGDSSPIYVSFEKNS